MAAPDLREWKRSVTTAAAAAPGPPFEVEFFGAANLIAGYRLYYMLDYAKRAGVGRLRLVTDGLFWIDEATDWLAESGVDEIEIIAPGGQLPAPLAARIRDLAGRGARITVTVAAAR